MSGFKSNCPGGVWHTVNSKALSYSFIMSANGFGGAMYSTGQTGGSIRHSMFRHHMPMVLSAPAHDAAPYFQAMPHMQGGGIMNVLKMIGSNLIGPFKDMAESLMGRNR